MRLLSAILLLVSFSLYPCPPELAGKQFVFETPLPQGLRNGFIYQPVYDFVFVEKGTREAAFDSPATFGTFEFFSLQSQGRNLCAYSKEKSLPPASIIKKVSIEAFDDAELTTQLIQASQLWSSADPSDKAESANLYQQVYYQLLGNKAPVAPEVGLMAVNSHLANFDYESALSLIVQLQTQSLPLRLQLKLSLIQGEIAIRQGRARDAQSILTAIESSMLSAPHPNTLASDKIALYAVLGEAFLIENQIKRGEESLSKGKIILENTASGWVNNRVATTLLDNFGFLFLKKAENHPERRNEMLNLALDAEYKALRFAIDANNPQEQVVIHSNIAWIHKSLYQLDSAQRNYLTALALLQHHPDKSREKLIFRNLGKVYLSVGLYKKALVYLDRAAELAENSVPVWFARINCLLGETNRKLGRLRQSRGHLKTCLDYFENETNLLDDYLLANVEHATNQLALSPQNKPTADDTRLMVTLAELSKNREIQARTYQFLAMQNTENVPLHWINKAIEFARLSADPTLMTNTYSTATRLALQMDDWQKARDYADITIRHIVLTSSQIDPVELGPAWSNQVDEFFSLWISALLEQGRKTPSQSDKFNQLAFHTSLQMRGASLLRSRQQTETRETIGKEHTDKISELTSNVISQPSKEQAKTQLALNIETDLIKLGSGYDISELSEAELHRFSLAQIHKLTPLTVEDQVDSLAKVQALLNENQRVLLYSMSEDFAGVFNITKTDFNYFHLGETSKIVEAVRETAYSVANRRPDVYQTIRQVSSLVLPQEVVTRPGEEWLISPHKELNFLPFAALTLPIEGKNTLLTEHARIVQLPSLSDLNQSVDDSFNFKQSEISIIAAPYFGDSEQPAATQQNRSWASSLPPLPWSEKEALSISELFGSNRSNVFLGRSANRHHLLSQKVRQSDILHIATHGYFDDQKPENVGFTLSLEDTEGKLDPGFVSFAELSRYAFDNHLVVINGCETALGETASGEGFQGIARSFLASGADHVIATLWPVSDRASARFMEIFYQKLHQQNDISVALQLTRKAMLRSPRFRHPFYWAGYTHYSVSN